MNDRKTNSQMEQNNPDRAGNITPPPAASATFRTTAPRQLPDKAKWAAEHPGAKPPYPIDDATIPRKFITRAAGAHRVDASTIDMDKAINADIRIEEACEAVSFHLFPDELDPPEVFFDPATSKFWAFPYED